MCTPSTNWLVLNSSLHTLWLGTTAELVTECTPSNNWLVSDHLITASTSAPVQCMRLLQCKGVMRYIMWHCYRLLPRCDAFQHTLKSVHIGKLLHSVTSVRQWCPIEGWIAGCVEINVPWYTRCCDISLEWRNIELWSYDHMIILWVAKPAWLWDFPEARHRK